VSVICSICRHEPHRSLDARVPELNAVVPSACDEDVGVSRVIDAGKHAVVVPVNTIEVAAANTHAVHSCMPCLAEIEPRLNF